MSGNIDWSNLSKLLSEAQRVERFLIAAALANGGSLTVTFQQIGEADLSQLAFSDTEAGVKISAHYPSEREEDRPVRVDELIIEYQAAALEAGDPDWRYAGPEDYGWQT